MIKSNTSHIGFDDTNIQCPMGVEAVLPGPGHVHVVLVVLPTQLYNQHAKNKIAGRFKFTLLHSWLEHFP